MPEALSTNIMINSPLTERNPLAPHQGSDANCFVQTNSFKCKHLPTNIFAETVTPNNALMCQQLGHISMHACCFVDLCLFLMVIRFLWLTYPYPLHRIALYT